MVSHQDDTVLMSEHTGEIGPSSAESADRDQAAVQLGRYQEVSRIGREINQDLGTIEAIFEKLRQHIPSIIEASQSLLLAVYKPQKGTLDLHIFEDGASQVIPDDPMDGGCQWVIEHGESLFVRELSREDVELRKQGVNLVQIPGTKPEVESLIFVPLLLRNADSEDAVVMGVLSVQHQQPNMFDLRDVRLLQTLGYHLALAISNIRLFTGLEQLTQSGQTLTRYFESEDLLDQIVEEIQSVTGADVVVLYPYSQAAGQFDLPPKQTGELRHPEFPPPSFSRPDDMATLTVQSREVVYARNSAHLFGKLGGNSEQRQGSFEVREEIASAAAVPLRVGDEPVGALFVNYRVRQRFDAPQKQMIQSLANYAAIAIRNARLFGSAQHRHIKELELLRDIDTRIGSILDLRELLQGILELAGEHILVDEASILLYDPKARVLDTMAAIGRNVEKSREQKVALEDGRGIVSEVFKQKQPIRIDNVRTDPQWRDIHLEVASDTLSELDVPIFDAGNVIGIINMESTREAAFTMADQDFMVTLAGQAVLAIKNAETYEREKRIAEERQALVEVGQAIVNDLASNTIFESILHKALEITGGEAGNLMIFDPQRNDLWMAAQRGVMPDKIGRRQSLDEGVVGRVATHKEPLNVDVCSPPWNETFIPYIPNVCSELAVPILLDEKRLVGVLNIESTERNYFDERDERLLTALAGMAAIAMDRLELVETRHLAEQRASAAEAMSAMGQSAFELAHRLGNDLGLVKAYVQNIEDLVSSQSMSIDGLAEELNKIKRDVKKVLDMSSALKETFGDYQKGGRPRYEAIDLPPAVLLEEAMSSLPEPPDDIQVRIHVEHDTAAVRADHSQVADILRNLFVNAIQAMPRGGTVTLNARNAGRFVEIQVSDTGIGIPKERQPRIFDLFYSTRDSFGFGLWSARRHALANGGDLTVTSEPRHGATFTLLLPMASATVGAR